ncbi:nitrogenase iron-molybdenum cofactor biosynthesis protein NifN [Methanobacterium sp. ACI-7]|uniref:nitrogenase iron-molybdenum cofactor biosynthesis protein NifN n=1 Tax=unclassified Methanobacterium TaxID=2627676 RepID=UPI0039C1D891
MYDETIKNKNQCIEEKKFAVINPCKMCQPMGAVQALLGVKGAMPLIHGSQGCSTYMRFQLCRHFREPVNVSSTSMSEGTVVYGGEDNLLKALNTIWKEYDPEIIGVTSSCLTETIGDDMALIIKKFNNSNNGEELPPIVPISTPSYSGSHVDGYDKAVKSLVENLARPEGDNHKINIIPGIVSPADIAEIKDILRELNVESIFLTDTSESLNAPLTDDVSFLPDEGTKVEEIRDSANSMATIALSKHADSAATYLQKKCGVKSFSGPLPVGINYTDQFIDHITKITCTEVPELIKKDRGKMIDAIVDAHPYNYERKVAIYGDPDVVTGLAQFVCELGMIPSVVCTGAQSSRFVEDMENIAEKNNISPVILAGRDLYDLHQQVKYMDIELLIGNSYGARIAEAEDIPLLRIGFPVYDRLGAQRISILGYKAGIRLVDTVTNMILENYYDESGHEIMEFQ